MKETIFCVISDLAISPFLLFMIYFFICSSIMNAHCSIKPACLKLDFTFLKWVALSQQSIISSILSSSDIFDFNPIVYKTRVLADDKCCSLSVSFTSSPNCISSSTHCTLLFAFSSFLSTENISKSNGCDKWEEWAGSILNTILFALAIFFISSSIWPWKLSITITVYPEYPRLFFFMLL